MHARRRSNGGGEGGEHGYRRWPEQLCPPIHESMQMAESGVKGCSNVLWKCRRAFISNADALQGNVRAGDDGARKDGFKQYEWTGAIIFRPLRTIERKKNAPHLSHSPQICSGDDGLQSIKAISLQSAGIHAGEPLPSNHPSIIHLFHFLWLFRSGRQKNPKQNPHRRMIQSAADAPLRFGGRGVCMCVWGGGGLCVPWKMKAGVLTVPPSHRAQLLLLLDQPTTRNSSTMRRFHRLPSK